jgi:hypothetical protein
LAFIGGLPGAGALGFSAAGLLDLVPFPGLVRLAFHTLPATSLEGYAESGDKNMNFRKVHWGVFSFLVLIVLILLA